MYVIWCFQLTRCSIPKKRSNCTLRSHCESFSSLLCEGCSGVWVCVCYDDYVCVCGTQIHTVSGRESFCSSSLWHPPTPGLRRETAYHQRQPTPPKTIPNTTTPHDTISLILTLHSPPPLSSTACCFSIRLDTTVHYHHLQLGSFSFYSLFWQFFPFTVFGTFAQISSLIGVATWRKR